MNQIYKLVDQIYCINLISRPDRYAHMKAFEKDSGAKINYFRPERDPSGGAIGCFKSHIAVISQAYDAGYSQVLVLEDDIIKTKSYDSINYNEIIQFIQTNNSWEIIQLSWFNVFNSLFVPNSSPYTHLSQGGTLLTSSYIINRKGMERILQTYKNYLGIEAVDEYYKKLFSSTMWNVSPVPFDQDRTSQRNNVWINEFIDSVLIWIHLKLDAVYNLSYYKYANGWIVTYLIILIVIYMIFYYRNK
jgi:GR25 family glycosyltransferase involved in LPS biosynthesis